jgi:predicted Zn-dependent peptidase
VRLVRRLFPGRAAGRPAPFRPVTAAVAQSSVALASRPIEQTHVALGLRLFGRRDPRRYALRLLNVMLGENMSSRLFQVVREQHGLAYAIQSSGHLFGDSGCLVIGAGLDRKRAGRALRLVLRELTRFRQRKVSPGELTRAKDYLIGQIRLSLESTTQQMMWVGENLVAYGEFIPPEKVIERLARVSADDVLAVARGVIRPARATLACIAPKESALQERTVRELLAALAP